MWTKEQSKQWKKKHASICIDCGKLCSPTAKRCILCESLKRTKVIPKFCPDCNKLIEWRAKRCRSCAIKHRWETGELRSVHSLMKGEQSHAWKGGKHKTSGGYIHIYQPNHPRAIKGYVLEHILVWEETNRKPLPKGWIVHHLNGIKDDNRPKNLQGFPNKKHYLVLEAKAKRIQELEALLNNQHQLL